MPSSSSSEPRPYPPPSYIDSQSLMQIKSLELRAKSVVEGLMNGIHRSPYHGFSVEFTEYRQYSTGDDLRYLDWRLFARSDRYYIKRFEDETNLRCHLIVDNSRSMTFGSLGYSKEDYAKTLAATLAYFLTQQRDAVGLFRFSDKVDEFIPARFRVGQLRRLLTSLESAPEGTSSGINAALEEAAERVRKRGLFVVMSDFLTNVDVLQSRLGYLRAGGNEVVVFQVLDPTEMSFDFDQPAVFLDAETGQELFVDPEQARSQYQKRLQEHLDQVSAICDGLGIYVSRLTTDSPIEIAMLDFLETRLRVTQTRRQ
ncbi:hypothetical protein KOR42_09400 [Thalassoglobus neptunius]|uniref:DUF58 domain-containing protein n=1 Tax=Thalassoglobus neptunius TaxID=1938619 RepID=A0A5C5X4D1_9PLAN|nr:DUF58 domain-containing protein [Thalassoglobus neptunius]TWT57578.1 hypothetical protein KOR42_09400 [Thalassoglobus neptunius]